MEHKNTRQHFVNEVLTKKYGWIPNHIGIEGNRKVYLIVKFALDKNSKIPYTELKPKIDKNSSWYGTKLSTTSCVKQTHIERKKTKSQ